MGIQHLHGSVCDLLGIRYPICLAGMGSQGRATPPALVAAVSNAGGLGVIGGAGLDAEQLRRAIRDTRKLTRAPIGVNLILPARGGAGATKSRSEIRQEIEREYPQYYAFVKDLAERTFGFPFVPVGDDVPVSLAATADAARYKGDGGRRGLLTEQMEVLLEEDVQVFVGSLGGLDDYAARAHARGMTVFGVAVGVDQASAYETEGADVIVAQGAEAGGHTGRVGRRELVRQIRSSVRLPVLAGGGIGDGSAIAEAIRDGAAGVWIGTAFLLADECAIPQVHKAQIAAGREGEFDADRIYSGTRMRGYRNAAIRAWEAAGLKPLPSPYQKVLMDDFNASAAQAGRWDVHSNPSGAVAAALHRCAPAREIFEALVAEAESAFRRD
ncbi:MULTISPECIES: nitronate monooxygenase family protein [Burkholderia cepacia complex]|uniref:NAD(P)H-dependent flavin oxidoreductase n=1 Tax=Burkholderia cepacia complex TaxID=87882 RepID=UPI000A9D895B|nr:MULTISPECIES: nitronate monooxygenase [Burkholderia cepacia complex]